MSKKTPQKAKVEAPKVTAPKEYENTTKRDVFTVFGRVRPKQCVTLKESEVVEGLASV